MVLFTDIFHIIFCVSTNNYRSTDWNERCISSPEKKYYMEFFDAIQVRWADLEEQKESAYRRDVGFVVGQTQKDWQRMTDPHYAERQLERTKYF